jgi:hypothetical protein
MRWPWCSPQFAVKVNAWVDELLTKGAVDLRPAPKPVAGRPWGERLSLSLQAHRLYIVEEFPRASFSIYTATAMEILMIEDELNRHRMPIERKDLPDGSIGRRFSSHCKKTGRHEPIGQAPLVMDHIMSGNQPLVVHPFVYDATARVFFEEWLHAKYIPEYMPEYFAK